MMTDKTDKMNPSGYVFKVLSGAMNGIEFSLGSHAYFMCVNNSTEEQTNLDYAERTLYLPAATPSHNFIVNLAEYVTDNEFVVTVNVPNHQELLTFTFNTICHVEGTYFAIKREDEDWNTDILKGVLPTMPSVEAEKSSSKVVVTKSSGSKYQWAIAASLFILLGVSGTFAWSNYNNTSTANSVDSSAVERLQQLIGNDVGYSVQQGRDNAYYVFAQSNQQADWVRQSVARSSPKDSWKIQTPKEEERRLAGVLERNNITFFTIRFNDLNAPTLVMSSTRNATDPVTLESVKNMLLEAMPYAKEVNIELKNDKEILRMAEEGLSTLGFDYQMIQSDNGVTLSTSMSNGDSRLAEFNRFSAQFYQLWGRNYIHFSIDLRDNALQGKSFKYGENGYVKMGKSHWVFNT